MSKICSEYEKFLRIAPDKLDPKYELIEGQQEEEYPHPFCKVMKKGTVYKEEVMQDCKKCGVWVDIFPYDHYPVAQEDRQEQRVKLTMYRTLVRAKCGYKTWVAHNKVDIKKWAKNVPFRMLAMVRSKKSIVQKYEHLVQKYNQAECEELFSHGCDPYGHCVISKSCFEEYVDLPFEDTSFACPSGYVSYLESLYGDYMQLPPESERYNRHSIIEVDFGEEE